MVYTVKYELDAEGPEKGEDMTGNEETAAKSTEEECADPTKAQVVKEGEHIFLDINGAVRIDVTESLQMEAAKEPLSWMERNISI